VNKKQGTKKTIGRILLKGDNITMMVNVSDK
jgi:small nuclear ribonucleoprotein E